MSRRFFVDPGMIRREGEDFVALLEGEEAHHAVRVLRLGPGDQVVLLDDSRTEYHGRIEAIAMEGKAPRVTVRGFSIRVATGEPQTVLTLVQALPKGDKMDEIVQKGTEVGISRFVPAISRRVIVDYAKGKAERRRERWRRIAYEAAKQARRGIRPEVAPIAPLADAVRSCAAMGPVLILWEGASRPIKAELQRVGAEMAGLRADRDDRGAFTSRMDLGEKERPALTLVVGPEGGFAEEEAREMERLGGRLVSLGPRILRTETAGPVAATMVLYELELDAQGSAPATR